MGGLAGLGALAVVAFGIARWGRATTVRAPPPSVRRQRILLKDATPAMLRDAIRTVFTGNAVLAPADLSALLDAQFRGEAPPPAAFQTLTEKERQVFRPVARGLTNSEVAAGIYASESTVKTHVGAILRKLALRDRVQIVVFSATSTA